MCKEKTENCCMRHTAVRAVKKSFVVLALVLTPLHAHAQYEGYQAVSDLAAFRREFTEESAKVKSIRSTFRQEKVLVALTEKIVSEGNFWFRRSDKVRLEYQKPFRYLVIMNEGKLFVRDEKAESRIAVSSNRLFQQINRVIIDCVQGTILSSNDFFISMFEDGDSYLLEMVPAVKGLREMFKSILLVVEKQDYSVRSINMNEPTGDTTTIIFTNKELNVDVPDAVFSF